MMNTPKMRVLNTFAAATAVINTTVEISNSLFIFQWTSSVEWACKVGRGMENLINLRRLRFIVYDDCIDWFWIKWVCVGVGKKIEWLINLSVWKSLEHAAARARFYCLVTIYAEFSIKILNNHQPECSFSFNSFLKINCITSSSP